MKIAFFSSSTGVGGAEKNIKLICSYLNAKNIDTYVILLRKQGILINYLNEALIKTYAFDISFNGILKGELFKLIHFLKEIKPDIIMLFGLRTNVIMRVLKNIIGRPKTVAAIRSTDDWRKWYHTWLDRITSGFVDIFISNSIAGKEAAVKREKIDTNKIHVVYNGIFLEDYHTVSQEDQSKNKKKFNIDKQDFVICEVANIRPMKGHKLLVDALELLHKQGYKTKMIFAGEDKSDGAILNYVKSKNLGDSVIFAGFIQDVNAVLSIADVFILPSLWEGLPTSILEAMAMRVPVIASSVGGIPELIGDGAGILIPPGDLKATVNALNEIIKDKSLRDRCVELAYSRVKNTFLQHIVMEKYFNIFNELLIDEVEEYGK